MPELNEELLHFAWRHRLLGSGPFISCQGNEILVLKPGEQNFDAGPDFFNAQVRVNGLVMAGNVETHVKSSDWLRHGHQYDKSYDRLILHAVYEHDADLPQNTGNQVEVL